MKDYNSELCTKQHQDIERRVGSVEATMAKSAEKQEERYARIHQRFDEVAEKSQQRFDTVVSSMMNRLPPWVTILIGLLTAACAGLAVAAVK